jgi:outer membrane immunogenic protein
MTNKLLLTLAASILAGGTSLAADLPARKAPPVIPTVVVPPPIWTGAFIGGSIGGTFGGNPGNEISGKNVYCIDSFCTSPTTPVSIVSGASSKSNSFIGGPQIGYNYQMSPDFVMGGVLDFLWLNRSGSSSYSDSSTIRTWTETRNFTDSFKQSWLATARLRFGPTFDQFWLYATGGLALGGLKSSASSTTIWTSNGGSSVAASGFGSTSGAAWGWTIGAGGEYKFTPNVSVFAEYLYYRLDKSYDVTVATDPLVTGSAASSTYRVKAKGDGNLVKIGLNYAFWTY